MIVKSALFFYRHIICTYLPMYIPRKRIGGAKNERATVAQRFSAGMHVPILSGPHTARRTIYVTPTMIYFHARVDIPEMREFPARSAKTMQFFFMPSFFCASANIWRYYRRSSLLRHAKETKSLIGGGPSLPCQ